MTLGVVGASHRTAPIEVRERLHVDDDALPGVLRSIRDAGPIRECAVLATCNRSEVYAVGAGPHEIDAAVVSALSDRSGLPGERVRAHLYAYRGRPAAEHLFRVTAGLDSMVVGESEIQGQVAEAYRRARELDPPVVGPVLHRLFQAALSAGGEVRSRTALDEGAASVPSAGGQLIGKVFGELAGRRAVVLGAGEMGRLTLAALRRRGVDDVVVASRTAERAEAAARGSGVRAVAGDAVWDAIARADILLTSTASPRPVVTADRLRSVRPDPDPPLVVLDIAVPRDVEAAVGDLPGVFLYNIDDLQEVVRSTESSRDRARGAAGSLIEGSVEDFWRWYRAREAVPLIRGIRERAERIRREELEQALSGVSGLSAEERDRIHRATRLVLKKVLHSPTVGLRELAVDEGDEVLELARRLFGLEPGGASDLRPSGPAGNGAAVEDRARGRPGHTGDGPEDRVGEAPEASRPDDRAEAPSTTDLPDR